MHHNTVDVALGNKEKEFSPESAEILKLEETPPEAPEDAVLHYLVGKRLHVLTFT
jgi:hypothetical protein